MPGEAGPGTVATLNRYPTWEYDLIKTLGGTPNPNNLAALNLWAQKEGVKSNAYNWLAVSNPNNFLDVNDPQYLSGNPDHIAQFPSTNAGVNGIADFLNHGYSDVVKVLTDPNASVADIGQVVASHSNAWGGDGAYIIAHSGETVTDPYSKAGDPIYAPTGTQVGPGGDTVGGGDTGFTQCKSSSTIIGGGGLGVHWNILNACQAKALAGGFVVGVGGVIIVAGMTLLVTSAIVKGPLGEAAKALPGPVGAVAGFAKSAAAKLPRGQRATPAPSEPLFEGRPVSSLSPQQQAYYREKGPDALSAAFAKQRAAIAKRKAAGVSA